MNITEKQINTISRSISILDIQLFIEQHRQEYEQFIKEEESKKQEHPP